MNDAVPALRLDRLTRKFGGVTAVSEIVLEVPISGRHGIIGPNGAGKTTLFNMISGEVRSSAGRIDLFGQDVTRMDSARRAAAGIGRTYQITRTFPGLTVRENLVLAVHGLRASKYAIFRSWQAYPELNSAVYQLAIQFMLERRLDSRASELSHGEQRQLEVALAVALKPRLLLLDEPGAGLSPGERVGMRELLKNLPGDLTLLMIEHDMDLVHDVVTHVSVLDFGQLVATGSTSDIQGDKRVRDIYLGSRG